jgi:hypothetical protein
MLRHSRPLHEIYRESGHLADNLPRREILPIPRIIFYDAESAAYDELEKYCEALAKRFGERRNGSRAQSLGLYLRFLRLRFASSPYAIGETLRRRRIRVEQTQLALAKGESASEVDREDQVAGDGEDDDAVIGELLRDRSPDDLAWGREETRSAHRPSCGPDGYAIEISLPA